MCSLWPASPYRGMKAALATQHGKDAAIAAPLADAPGIVAVVPPEIDTDSLGTFTGEIPRPGAMRETARMKAALGMAASGLTLGIASEGSFGPHPAIPFLPAAREVMIFVDETHGLEIVEEQLTTMTNFDALDMTPGADLEGFLARCGFPEHALIFRCRDRLVKGITSREVLDDLLRDTGSTARLETDMRAHLNPTRMAEIAELAKKLARRIATPCPSCAAPGFGIVRTERGLPCEQCDAPTGLVRTLISGCAVCGHEDQGPRTDGRITATPSECQECNP
jgi:hypothetical protein